MATGYTSTLHDGPQSFEDFTLNCARAFGYLFELRETPNAPIPEEFAPDPFSRDQLRNSRRRLETALKLTVEEAAVIVTRDHLKALKQFDADVLANAALRRRYEGMLDQVKRWNPPTSEHEGLKAFMIEQLESSIKHDCRDFAPPAKPSAEAYRESHISSALGSVEYDKKCWEREQKSAAEKTAWVKALRCSLGVK
jgi:hypothetical protein